MTTILVVDDSQLDREVTTDVLSADPTLTIETATDGAAALKRIKRGGVDLVVTDLVMPEVDGLQMVETIRENHPSLPVILITSQGTEVIAMEALEKGAANYVPKEKLNEWLVEAVQDVLALAQTERAYHELIACFNSTQFDLVLPNDATLIDPLIEYVQQIVVAMKLCDATGGYQLGVALREALLNALFRGNLEMTSELMLEESERLVRGESTLVEERRAQPPYRDRKIYVDAHIGRDEARFVIQDEGRGFDTTSLPARGDPKVLEELGGRGLVLMHTFMDEVAFNQAGNEVMLIKRGRSNGKDLAAQG